MLKVKYHKIRIEPCNATMRVFFDENTFRNYCKNAGYEDIANSVTDSGGMFVAEDCFAYSMYLPEEFNDQVVYHEALHCATRLWDDAGAELHSYNNDEVLTYTQGYIVAMLKELYLIREESYGITD